MAQLIKSNQPRLERVRAGEVGDTDASDAIVMLTELESTLDVVSCRNSV